ncbi:MAG TPA: hypothetical protein VEI97_16445 [bacterium]|nr:hypothetical protein [bacterium]
MRRTWFALGALALLLAGPVRADDSDAAHDGEGHIASAEATGAAMVVVGSDPYNMNSTAHSSGAIAIQTFDEGDRWSQLQNIDKMDIQARFTHGGSVYEVTCDRPMVRHPDGAYTTWFGVTYNKEMHGDTGIGTAKVPKVKPAIATWGFATVKRDGQVIAAAAPTHVMVMTEPPLKGIALEVATEDKSLLGTPDGYLHVMWPEVASLALPEQEHRTREAIGWVGLLAFVGLFTYLAYRDKPERRTEEVTPADTSLPPPEESRP